MKVLVVGGSKNIGYYVAQRLLGMSWCWSRILLS